MTRILVCPKCGHILYYEEVRPGYFVYSMRIDEDGAADVEFDHSTLPDDISTISCDAYISCSHCSFREACTPEQFIERHPEQVRCLPNKNQIRMFDIAAAYI